MNLSEVFSSLFILFLKVYIVSDVRDLVTLPKKSLNNKHGKVTQSVEKKMKLMFWI